MSNINFNSFNEFLNENNISPSLNQTVNTTTLSSIYNNELNQIIFIPSTQISSDNNLTTTWLNPGTYNYFISSSLSHPTTSTHITNDQINYYSQTNPIPTIGPPQQLIMPMVYPLPTPSYSQQLLMPITYTSPTPTSLPMLGNPGNAHHHGWTPGATGPYAPPNTHPQGWNPSWGATGTHPPHSVMAGYSGHSGQSGHTGYYDSAHNWIAKPTLLSNKFSFEDKQFSIKIHYINEKECKFLRRMYHLKYNELDINTILKINEETFEPIHNKKFDRIVEIIEKLSKMNLYFSNICKSIMVKDIFINKRLSSRFEIEI